MVQTDVPPPTTSPFVQLSILVSKEHFDYLTGRHEELRVGFNNTIGRSLSLAQVVDAALATGATPQIAYQSSTGTVVRPLNLPE